ncbi:glycosyltransferase family 2 protein [Methylophaga thalassica]|uniref:glycosyltransferase family 2 protein n=1 Tax=Methylophaga aminisulfidivorans TaxID=230105 RepID=UPI0024E1F9B5|nr:glycosyltransferase family 2 protein [Methylophaga aminisulfidivorans]
MSSLLISICIPVYNCGDYLGDALESILPQLNEEIEVIIYDGGSTDQTALVGDKYQRQSDFAIRYYRSPQRGGIDADMAKCVSLAQGQYCWLFSGDDTMRLGALAFMKEQVQTGCDVYIATHTICDINMNILREHPVLNIDHKFQVDFSNEVERLSWFQAAVTSEAFFSFMSGLVVKRETWDSGRLIPQFDGSCWAHVARLLEISKHSLRVQFVTDILLDQRGENDSFLDKGVINRYAIGIQGYSNIANFFYGEDSQEAFHIRRVIRNEFRLRSFLSAKILTEFYPEIEKREVLDSLLKTAYMDKSIKNFFVKTVYTIFPKSVFLVVRFFYRAFKRINVKFKNV